MENAVLHDAERIAKADIKEIPLENIKLDPNNVRFLHESKRLSDKDIEEKLWKESDTKNLYKQILSVGGIYEEPVLNADLVVLEGNRRVVCLRKLKKEAETEGLQGISKTSFNKIKCKILPKETPQQVIDVYLAKIHVKGKQPWKAFNKSKHIFNLYESAGWSYDDLSKKLGMGKSTVIKAVKAYKATEEYGKEYPQDKEWFRQYTYFHELYTRKDLKEFREKEKNLKKFKNWVFHKKFKNDVRKVRRLASVLNDNEAMEEFEKKDIDAALNILGIKDASINNPKFKKIKETQELIINFSRKEFSDIVNDPSKLTLIYALKREIDNLVRDIKSMKKKS